MEKKSKFKKSLKKVAGEFCSHLRSSYASCELDIAGGKLSQNIIFQKKLFAKIVKISVQNAKKHQD